MQWIPIFKKKLQFFLCFGLGDLFGTFCCFGPIVVVQKGFYDQLGIKVNQMSSEIFQNSFPVYE